MAHDVFISYAGKDRGVAEQVCRGLEAEGIRCWIAPRDVPFGADFEDSIVDAIATSRILVLILSKHSNASRHVKREIQNACAEGSETRIIPLRIEAVPYSGALRYYLASAQWLDASAPPLEDHLRRLVEDVRAHLRPPDGKSPPGPKEVGPPPPARRKLLFPIVAGVVLLAAVAAGVSWLSGRGNDVNNNAVVPRDNGNENAAAADSGGGNAGGGAEGTRGGSPPSNATPTPRAATPTPDRDSPAPAPPTPKPPTPTPREGPQPRSPDDLRIEALVERALSKNKNFIRVGVSCAGGVVTLTGGIHTDDEEQFVRLKDLAEKHAMTVEGVRHVVFNVRRVGPAR